MSPLIARRIDHHDTRLLGTFALTFAALAWGFVNFGVLLWLPSALWRKGAASVQQARSSRVRPDSGADRGGHGLPLQRVERQTLPAPAIGITTLGLVTVMMRDTKSLPYSPIQSFH